MESSHSRRPFLPPPKNVPHTLPYPLTNLIGRREELADLAVALTEGRLVSLVGAPGVGKTRLAIHVAFEEASNYPDGLWLVDLARVAKSSLIAQSVASVLSVREQPGKTITEAVVQHLADQRVLLVLDNCDHVLQPSKELISVLLAACPNLVVLATSREALRVAGEVVLTVRPLSVPSPTDSPMNIARCEAVILFVSRAPKRFSLTEDTTAVIGRICRRLDGIPLAIELAARWVGEFTPHEVEAKLDDRFQFLTSDLSGLPSRHQALKAALDWSYDLLPELEAELLRRLSVFAGPFVADTVRHICAGGRLRGEEVDRLLRKLVERSFVVAETVNPRSHYYLHESIRHYARHKLAGAGGAEIHFENHARWCVDLAEQADSEQSGHDYSIYLAQLRANAEELRAALVWSLEQSPDIALALAGSLSRFWVTHGYLEEGKEWLDQALKAASGPTGLRVRALWGAGLLECLMGHSAAAASLSQEALDLAEGTGAIRYRARILNLLGVSRVMDNPSAAPGVLIEAVAMARASGETISLISSLGMLGFANYLCGDYSLATMSLEECVSIGRRFGDSQALTIGLVGWGAVNHQRGDLEHARELLEDGLAVACRINDPMWSAVGLSYLAELTAAMGNYDCARHTASEAVRTAHRIRSFPVVALCLTVSAKVDLAADDPAAALHPLQEALSICRSSQLAGLYTQVLVGIGRARLGLTQFDRAQVSLEEAVLVSERAKNPLANAEALHWFGRLTTALNDPQKALSLHLAALGLQQRGDQLIAVPSSLESVGRLVAEGGDEERGARLLGAADSLRARMAVARSVEEQREWELTSAHIGRKLNSAHYEVARSAGSRLTTQQAVADAKRNRCEGRRSAWGWSGLTATERRVVDLVAFGLTNREVGERLFISPRTVQTHLTRVYQKLNLRSRTELAREVAALRSKNE